jgi:hypothetical protein
LAFKVLRFDIYLSESTKEMRMRKTKVARRWHTLLNSFLDVLLCRIQLLLKKLNLASEAVVGGPAALSLSKGGLVIS